MAGFIPNLEDGERFLPSDIFHNDRLPPSALNSRRDRHHHHHRCPFHRHSAPQTDDLAQQFMALSLLRQAELKRPVNASADFERFIPPGRDGAMNHLMHGYDGVNVGHTTSQRFYEYGSGAVPSRAQTVNNLRFVKPPTPTQIERATWNRVLQNEENRLMQQQNQISRKQGNGISGFGLDGGFRGQSGGTGVFHPRIIKDNRTITSSSVSKNKQCLAGDSRGRPMQVNQGRNGRVGENSREEECSYHVPPRMRACSGSGSGSGSGNDWQNRDA